MDTESEKRLAAILRTRSTAAFGTVRNEGPFVSMTLFVAEADFSAFYIHASKLAFHTQDILKDPRVSLMVSEPESADSDPQQLARVSLIGEIAVIARDDPDYIRVRQVYLEKFPANTPLFNFGDFDLYRITPRSARYVAGFARAFNLTPAALVKAAAKA